MWTVKIKEMSRVYIFANGQNGKHIEEVNVYKWSKNK